MPKRFKDIPTQARSAAADDFLPIDGATNNSRRISPHDLVGQFRNALTSRGGVAFDGMPASAVYVTLTNQNIGSDDFSLVTLVRVPTSAPIAYAPSIGLSAVADVRYRDGSFVVEFSTNGALTVALCASAGGVSNRLVREVPNIVSQFGGREIVLAITRSAGGLLIYINGSLRSSTTIDIGTPPAVTTPLTTTFLAFGASGNGGSVVLPTVWRAVTLYNLALSSADVQEIYELGGAVPERFKFGSQADLATTPTIGSWTGSVSGRVISASTASTGYISGTLLSSWGRGIYRLIYDLTLNSGIAPCLGDGNTFGSARLVAGSAQSLTFQNTVSTILRFENGYAASNFSLTITAIQRLGAVVHLPLDDGGGFQLRDVSTNALHALMTATGVSHVRPLNGPFRARFQSNTNGNQQLGGQVVIPGNAQILRVRAKASTGTPNVTLGTLSGGSQIVASVALSTAWQTLTIALPGGQVGGSNISLWAGSNSAATIDWDITWEPLSA